MSNIEKLKQQGHQLFQRDNLMSLWQEIADNFYPERADFTLNRTLGEDFASHLQTSYPILARRDLGNQIGGMLRPNNKEWFKIIAQYDQENLDHEGKAFLEWATKLQKRAMYDPIAMLTRATKEADHDWASFGQCVISCQLNLKENALLHRCWHLRDVAWVEDEIGRIGTVYRKWKPTALTLNALFPKTVHPKIKECLSKTPYKKFDVWHIECSTEIYGNEQFNTPMVSIYYDIINNQIMEEIGVFEGIYVIPRWQTVSGSQYAFSPATVAALPDARLIQSMTETLLSAGEKFVDPPMLAVQEAIRSDISIYAGGITWVDAEYDERLGEVLREMRQTGSLPAGFEMSEETRKMITEAFYLNKLSLPPSEREMTAFETSQRIQEYIRQALPLFEPMETEYNNALCQKDFNILLRAGAFGEPRNFPKSLQGSNIDFQFESPLREAIEREKGQRFLESKNMIREAVELDSSAIHIMDAKTALRDVLTSIGAPLKWQRSEQEVKTRSDKMQQLEEAQIALQGAQQSADVVKTAGEAVGNA